MRLGFALVLAAFSLSPVARAQDRPDGHELFLEHCASCHGVAAHGDGWLGKYLRHAAPALDTLARRSGGAFPADRVRAVIDGRNAVAVHGPREMPVWGLAFGREFARHDIQASVPITPEPQHFPPPPGGEQYVERSISALVDFLAGIQK